MIKEFFESVRTFCTDQSAVVPKLLADFRSDHRTLWYWNPQDKTVNSLEVSPPDKRHKLLTTMDVVAYVNRLIVTADVTHVSPVIWVGNGKITIETTEGEHRDLLSMEFKKSPLFTLLERLHAKPSVSQQDAIRLLRQQFAAFDSGAKALTAARSLRITKLDAIESDQSHLANRIGKSIQQDAAGAGELPEYLDVSVAVFLGSNTPKATIRVWLSIDFSNPGCLRFEPDETALEAAILDERAAIAEELQSGIDNALVAIYEGEYCV